MNCRATENILTVFAASNLETFDLGSLGGEAAEEADVVSVDGVVDADVLGSKQVVDVVDKCRTRFNHKNVIIIVWKTLPFLFSSIAKNVYST